MQHWPESLPSVIGTVICLIVVEAFRKSNYFTYLLGAFIVSSYTYDRINIKLSSLAITLITTLSETINHYVLDFLRGYHYFLLLTDQISKRVWTASVLKDNPIKWNLHFTTESTTNQTFMSKQRTWFLIKSQKSESYPSSIYTFQNAPKEGSLFLAFAWRISDSQCLWNTRCMYVVLFCVYICNLWFLFLILLQFRKWFRYYLLGFLSPSRDNNCPKFQYLASADSQSSAKWFILHCISSYLKLSKVWTKHRLIFVILQPYGIAKSDLLKSN